MSNPDMSIAQVVTQEKLDSLFPGNQVPTTDEGYPCPEHYRLRSGVCPYNYTNSDIVAHLCPDCGIVLGPPENVSKTSAMLRIACKRCGRIINEVGSESF